MNEITLRVYATRRIRELKLGTTPTNCHGVEIYEDTRDSIRLSDGIGLDEICTNRREIDAALQCLVDA